MQPRRPDAPRCGYLTIANEKSVGGQRDQMRDLSNSQLDSRHSMDGDQTRSQENLSCGLVRIPVLKVLVNYPTCSLNVTILITKLDRDFRSMGLDIRHQCGHSEKNTDTNPFFVL